MYILSPITLTPSMFTNNNVPVNDFAVWSNATNYTVGTKVIRTTTNKIYRNLIAGIDTTLPENAPTRWFDEGYVNAYKMIDDLSSSQTSNLSINQTVDVGARVGALAFINLVGTSLTITATNNGAESIYSKTISLDDSSVTSIYDWFFEPFVQKTDHFEIDFPEAYQNPIITYTISNASGANSKIGRFMVAKQYQVGYTQYGSTIGIRDYSIKSYDANNIAYLNKKDNVKIMTFKLVLDQGETNRVVKLLRQLLSVPSVFIGVTDNGYEYTIAHGFYQSFRIPLQTPSVNYCELDVEELI